MTKVSFLSKCRFNIICDSLFQLLTRWLPQGLLSPVEPRAPRLLPTLVHPQLQWRVFVVATSVTRVASMVIGTLSIGDAGPTIAFPVCEVWVVSNPGLPEISSLLPLMTSQQFWWCQERPLAARASEKTMSESFSVTVRTALRSTVIHPSPLGTSRDPWVRVFEENLQVPRKRWAQSLRPHIYFQVTSTVIPEDLMSSSQYAEQQRHNNVGFSVI